MKKFSIALSILLLLFGVNLWAVDTTYGPKVYKTDGGDRQVVADGGTIEVESGGYFTGVAYKVATKAMTAVTDWTLSATEMICNMLIATGSGSGDAIIAPNVTGRLYIVRNATDSTITIKKSAGTGVSIATGKTVVVIHSGSDYVRVTADATH